MKEIALLTGRIYVGQNLLSDPSARIPELAGDLRRVFLLTDQNCLPLARPIEERLKSAGTPVRVFALPPGESQKKLSTAARLYGRLASFRMDRQSLLVAVGGGVITDLGGYVASTYMRGIPLVLVSTTLLGQVDAAIGGKTAVNLPRAKNLVGTFYQPRAVLCDPAYLKSLPAREYTSGLGEVVKYGMIYDAGFFEFIEKNIPGILRRDPEVLEEIVHRSVQIKAAVVGQDERESGLRAILNYGHTIGHALEAAGGFESLSHGEAVAIGMEAEAILSMELGIAPLEVLAAQNRVLKLCGLPTRAKRLPQKKVLGAMKLDKKGRDGQLRFVLPEAVGKVRWPVEVPPDLITAALRTVTA